MTKSTKLSNGENFVPQEIFKFLRKSGSPGTTLKIMSNITENNVKIAENGVMISEIDVRTTKKGCQIYMKRIY